MQIVKIVSDNAENSWRDLEKGQLGRWFSNQMDDIIAGTEELLSLSADEMKRCAMPTGFDEMLSVWRFTETEKHLLKKMLYRRQVIMPDAEKPVLFCRSKEVKSGAEALQALREELAQVGDELSIKH